MTEAELLALREGLKLAWDMRVARIEVEIDSEVVLKLVNRANIDVHPLGAVIADCRKLLRMPWEGKFKHTRREGNACADALAKQSQRIREFHLWTEPPEAMQALLREDSI
ncbi:putative ribonuclease H protein [Sesamum alatum]|uniref:Ribonuclease H protein n=1 Tax=Sesamum alatum TaxID=300844 RepID=A0AAE1YMN3_9LAMI|nr:putative ribonuclease H protein [Sesamum alatum]